MTLIGWKINIFKLTRGPQLLKIHKYLHMMKRRGSSEVTISNRLNTSSYEERKRTDRVNHILFQWKVKRESFSWTFHFIQHMSLSHVLLRCGFIFVLVLGTTDFPQFMSYSKTTKRSWPGDQESIQRKVGYLIAHENS